MDKIMIIIRKINIGIIYFNKIKNNKTTINNAKILSIILFYNFQRF